MREACAKTGMSYSKGWKLIHTAEEETGWKIVERMSGGKNGGEAYITERGHMLLKNMNFTGNALKRQPRTFIKMFFKTVNYFN